MLVGKTDTKVEFKDETEDQGTRILFNEEADSLIPLVEVFEATCDARVSSRLLLVE